MAYWHRIRSEERALGSDPSASTARQGDCWHRERFAQQRGLGPRVRYFLLLIVCGTHQVGLAAKSAVAGRTAAVARGLLYQDIVGVTVRLFKYLINDYYDEFVFSVNEWVLRDLEVLPSQAAGAARHASPLFLAGETQGRGGSLASPAREASF